MAEKLRAVGFEVILRNNVTQKEMNRAVVQFGQRLTSGSVGLFYFAGHGLQVRGKNFLIPIDAMDWQEEYDKLRSEVKRYSADLAARPHCVVFTKLDLMGEEYIPDIKTEGAFALFSISAAARQGLDKLKDGLWRKLLELKKPGGGAP